MLENDTIVAIATPTGIGGIAIIKLSGPEAVDIADTVFKGKKRITDLQGYHMAYGKVNENGTPLDEVIVTLQRAPQSYTRDDVVEINCHGGMFVAQKVVKLLKDKGARLAEPGEFTKRAFLSGRIDLSQAEAVLDVIRAECESQLNVSRENMMGKLGKAVDSILEKEMEIMKLVEVSLDFSEEDITIMASDELRKLIETVIYEMENLLDNYDNGKVLREGYRIVITGRQNAGKSTLLNTVLGEERAIVTEIPGTTRDKIEEYVTVNGLLLKFVDTAGWCKDHDIIGKRAIEITENEINKADTVLFLHDITREMNEEDTKIIKLIEKMDYIPVLNKVDLSPRASTGPIEKPISGRKALHISAKTGEGIDKLLDAIVSKALGSSGSKEGGTWLFRERQRDAVQRAKVSAEKAIEAIDTGLTSEYVAFDLRESIDALGEIIGKTTTDDILKAIFDDFCIGK